MHRSNQNGTISFASTRTLKAFRRDDDGGMIIFSLIMFVLLLTFGGMAVDFMRFETTRAKLQGTMDRCVLAAADLDQSQPPAEVVRDCFEKAGMIQFLQGEPIVDEGLNFRKVTVNASAEMPLLFYDIGRVFTEPFTPGLSTLTVSGGSSAEERVSDVEVSLILDVSSSMNENGRLENLRPAAREFVSTVLANNTNAPKGLITISMIPYSAVVNPGPELIPFLTNIDRTHNFSTCPRFDDDSLFETTVLDMGGAYGHISHFDYDEFNARPVPIAEPWCYVGDRNAIIPHSSSVSDLHTAIDNLAPYGNTAIDMGMKWGVGLLDPSLRHTIDALASTDGNSVAPEAAGRPAEFPLNSAESDVLKVVVLMTDGANTQQWDLFDRFKDGDSFVWFNLEDDPNQPLHLVRPHQISIQRAGLDTPNDYNDDRFYWNIWASYYGSEYYSRPFPIGYSSQEEYRMAMNAGHGNRPLGVGRTYNNNVRRASWQELYANWAAHRVNNELMSRAYNHGAIPWEAGTTGWPDYIHYDDYVDSDRAINHALIDGPRADTRLSNLCAAARDRGIVIYTVAFDAPYGGQQALRDCAGVNTPSRYFNVVGTDISKAFSAIASDIRQLKLVQ